MLPQIGLSGKEASPGHEYDGVGVITVSDNINIDEENIDDDSLLRSFTEAKRTLVSVIEEKKRSQLPDSSFGIPEDRKYPLDTKKHVESAIRLFAHAEKSKKKELAKRIKAKADEYNIEIPETTQCYKYLQESHDDNYKISYSKSFDDVKDIVNSLSKTDLNRICNGTFKNSPHVLYREVLLMDNKPASFIDVYKLPNMKEDGIVVVATKPENRGMGFSSILVDRMKSKLKGKNLVWKTQKDNEKSIHLANKINIEPTFEGSYDNNYIMLTTESDDASKITKDFKLKKPEGKFKFIDLQSSGVDKYLDQDSYCRKDRKEIKNNRIGEIVIDEEADKLVGYCFVFKSGEYKGCLSPLFISKKYRGYGLSNKLVENSIRKYHANKLYVFKDNEIAINLYKKHGFKIVKQGKDGNGEKCCEMRLSSSTVTEACKDVQTARKFVSEVGKLAKKYNANYFIVTDGASGIHNQGEPAVKFHRDKQIEWEKKNGFDPDDDWSNESKSCITESKIFNDDDIYYNKDKFDSGEINLCFIIGHSGSGKSTMANGMEKQGIEKYELDDLAQNHAFSDQNLKEYGDLIYSFFKGPGKKYRFYSWDEAKEIMQKLDEKNNGDHKKSDDEFWGGMIRDFVKFAISYAKSHKDKKIVLEGVWIVDYMKESDFKDFAVYIKGTSLLISRWRAAKRDSQDAPNNFERAKARFKNFTSKKMWASNSKFEHELKRWTQYFKNK